MKARIPGRIISISSLYACALFAYLMVGETGRLSLDDVNGFTLLYLVLSVNTGVFLLIAVTRRIDQWTGTGVRTQSRFLVTLPVNLVFLAAFALLAGKVYLELFHDGTFASVIDQEKDAVLKLLIILVFSVIAYTMSDFAMFAFKKYTLLKLGSDQLRRRQMDLQLEALKSQLKPHFLFNSLNTVSSLVYRDAGQTEEFIRNLATTYRYILSNFGEHFISLDEEVRMVRAYSGMMAVRYEDSFHAEILVEDGSPWAVPPLSIQMLVENAVKHNRFTPDVPLRVRIFIENEILNVQNNYIGMPDSITLENDLIDNPGKERQGTGIGLENIRQRYRFLTGRDIRIEKDHNFTVGLPLIPKEMKSRYPISMTPKHQTPAL